MISLWKNIKRISMAVLLLTGLLIGSNKSEAYQYETHFLEIFAMLVHAGIHPAIAERIAAYDQWVDVSTLNSAMNPIPFVHGRVSRLLHFPIEGIDPFVEFARKVMAKIKVKVDPHGHENILNLYNDAQRDSFIANEIFNEALKTGNEYLIGASLHTLKDSFAHEGFIYSLGHFDRGRFPDRPWMFLEKHDEMRKLLFKAIRRISQSLPSKGLTDIQVNGLDKLNRNLSPEELFSSYAENPHIIAATKANPHRDPLYTATGIGGIVDGLVAEGAATAELKVYIATNLKYLFFEPSTKGGPLRSGREVLEEIIKHLFSLSPDQRKSLMNDARVLECYGNLPKEYRIKNAHGDLITIDSQQTRENMTQGILIERMVNELSKHTFPEPALGDSSSAKGSKVTFEFGQASDNLFEVEENLQEARWQDVFVKVYKLAPLVLDQRKMATKLVIWLKGAIGVNGEKLQGDLEKMNREFARNSKIVSVSVKERAGFMWALFKYTTLDFATYRVTQLLVWLKLMESPRGNLRLINADVKDAKLWQDDSLFTLLRERKVFQDIYSEESVNRLIANWTRTEEKFAEKLLRLNGKEGLTANALERVQMQTPNPILGTAEERSAASKGFLRGNRSTMAGSQNQVPAPAPVKALGQVSCLALL